MPRIKKVKTTFAAKNVQAKYAHKRRARRHKSGRSLFGK